MVVIVILIQVSAHASGIPLPFMYPSQVYSRQRSIRHSKLCVGRVLLSLLISDDEMNRYYFARHDAAIVMDSSSSSSPD